MRGGFLEHLARIHLGTSDRQVGVDRIGPDSASWRQLSDVKGQQFGGFAKLHQSGFDADIRSRAQFVRRRSTGGGSRSSGVANSSPEAGLAVSAPMGTANSNPTMTGDIQSRSGSETA